MGEEIGHYVYTNWRRFLDDCYINWPYGEDKLKEIRDILNSLDDSIQLTAETSCEELPYLDVMIRKDNAHPKVFPRPSSPSFSDQLPMRKRTDFRLRKKLNFSRF